MRYTAFSTTSSTAFYGQHGQFRRLWLDWKPSVLALGAFDQVGSTGIRGLAPVCRKRGFVEGRLRSRLPKHKHISAFGISLPFGNYGLAGTRVSRSCFSARHEAALEFMDAYLRVRIPCRGV